MDPMPIDPEQDAGLQVAAGDPVATRRYRIEGMHCTGCASELQSALRSRTEVASATVDFTSGLAVVEGDLEVPPTLEVIASRPQPTDGRQVPRERPPWRLGGVGKEDHPPRAPRGVT